MLKVLNLLSVEFETLFVFFHFLLKQFDSVLEISVYGFILERVDHMAGRLGII
jgi:hypothetical protein